METSCNTKKYLISDWSPYKHATGPAICGAVTQRGTRLQ